MSERFEWSPEPELIDIVDEPRSRAALEALGEQTWREALDWLYGEALRRPMHSRSYPDARRDFFGPTNHAAPAPMSPSPWSDVLAEFRERVAPATYNAQHPGSFSYFTPPPLPSSIAGEMLSQWIHQGVDVWHAGPIGTFVEEEVTDWLRELVGFGPEGWGVLTSGGVMANVMAMTVARDVWLSKLRGTAGAPRGADLDGVRVYASDQTHFSIARALGVLGFPDETLVVVESDERFRMQAAPVAEAIERDRAAGLTPLAIAAVAGSTNTGSVDDTPGLADVAEREGVWLHVDAAYGGAARLSRRDAHRVPGLERADTRHDRSPQVVLPGLRHRGPRGTPTRGSPEHVPRGARVLRVEPPRGRASELVPVLPGGHAAVPRAEALDELEADGHRWAGCADRAERRPRGVPGGSLLAANPTSRPNRPSRS